MPKTIHIMTYGCQMNDYESDRTFQLFRDHHNYQWCEQAVDADLVLFNTCSIRDKADHKAMSAIGELRVAKERRPHMVIAVGGCMAQIQGDELKKRFPYVDIVFGTHQWNKLPELVQRAQEKESRLFQVQQMEKDFTSWKNYNFLPPPREISNDKGDTQINKFRIRENVTIQNGCNQFCTFCLVPFTRGREVSRPIDEILSEIQHLADHGVKEVNLLGQNVNAYGTDRRGEPEFSELLNRVASVSGIERIRFVTSHPAVMTFGLIDAMAENKKVCEHLHLPIQSGSNRILESMNRKYTIEHYRKLVQYLRLKIPNLALTTDIIVGFPGETEEDFQLTLNALREFDFDESYSFVYSPRPHTKASAWEDQFVPPQESRERLYRLQQLQRQIRDEHTQKLVGQAVEILVESSQIAPTGQTIAHGRTRTFQNVSVSSELPVNTLQMVKIVHAQTYSLEGNLLP